MLPTTSLVVATTWVRFRALGARANETENGQGTLDDEVGERYGRASFLKPSLILAAGHLPRSAERGTAAEVVLYFGMYIGKIEAAVAY